MRLQVLLVVLVYALCSLHSSCDCKGAEKNELVFVQNVEDVKQIDQAIEGSDRHCLIINFNLYLEKKCIIQ